MPASINGVRYCVDCFVKIINEWRYDLKDCSRCRYWEGKENGTGVCRKLDNVILYPRISTISPPVFHPQLPQAGIFSEKLQTYYQARTCIHYENKDEFLKKAMAGEIEPKKEASHVKCQYCGSTYDEYKDPKCPNCGATQK
jgi:hypothetical protein